MTTGRYKGIPWRVVRDNPSHGLPRSVHFYAPAFTHYLAVRIALIPLVRRAAIASGGFSMLGTAFEWRGTIWHLFGRPGTGKTRLLLDALEDGGRLVGDLELVVLANGTIRPLFDLVELRYATVRQTRYWQLLTRRQRAWLHLCRAISSSTARRISFNLEAKPEDLGWQRVTDLTDFRHVLVGLSKSRHWDSGSIIDDVADYYAWYESIHGRAIMPRVQERNDHLARNLRRYVRRNQVVSLGERPRLHDLLNAAGQ